MNVNKARKHAIFLSVSSIFAGAVFLLMIALFYFNIQSWLENIIHLKPSPEVIASLVNIIKSFLYRAIPSLSIILITFGVSMLFYLRAWNKTNE